MRKEAELLFLFFRLPAGPQDGEAPARWYVRVMSRGIK